MNTKETMQWQEEQAMERYRMIAPLLDETLDTAKKLQLRRQLAEQHLISARSLYRYEKAYHGNGFHGLKPMAREMRRASGLPDHFKELVNEAIQLKREVPTRSVAQIILILEMEGKVEPGILKRSTLQRHLYDAGFGKKQMKKYTDARASSTKRYCKEHRMQLAQADIKYGPKLPIGPGGKNMQTYLVAVIDDHSKVILASGFYDNQEKAVVEDTYRRAILQFGAFSATYVDNGKQFVSTQLVKAFSKLGIRHLRAKPRAAWSKGKIEVYNRFVNSFLAEAKAQKIKTLEELNYYWNLWVEEYYHNKAHDGIKEYYESHDIAVPAEGITPMQEWNRDKRPLKFLDARVVGDAFLHQEQREVDKGACISFQGRKYETHASLIGARVEIHYDPMDPSVITVSYPGVEPFTASPLRIGPFCDKTPEIPVSMLPEEPEHSRFLEGLEKRHKEHQTQKANAISFGEFRKGGDH